MQTYACMDAINRFCAELGYTKENQPPLIFCGDLNSMEHIGMYIYI
jgi:endonuclease/exonuclease/phosphatase family metal-dependent hydrolase